MTDELKSEIDELTSPKGRAAMLALQAQIASAWDGAPIPPAELLLRGHIAPDRKKLDPESVEVLDYFSGRANNQLPFNDTTFENLSPFNYISLVARKYYISAYMIKCIDHALAAAENSGGGCGMIEIVTIRALLNEDEDWKISGLTEKQKLAVRAFLEFVCRYPKFYYLREEKASIEKYLKNEPTRQP